MLESLFNKAANLSKRDSNAGAFFKIGEVYLMSSFFYRTPPVVFAAKQRNIQCYNDNFGLKPKIVMGIL